MRLYKFTCGVDERVGVFADSDEAYERRTEVDPTFHFLPVTIEEIEIPGYAIVPTDAKPPDADEFDVMDRKQLVEWLKDNNVDYVPQWGDAKLRDAARASNK